MTKNITFTLPAVAMEGASEAYLLGDFNNWNSDIAPKLEKQKDGSYKTIVKLEEGKTYQYRFLLNNGRWVNDYNAENYPPVEGLNVDNSEITVPVSEREETKKNQHSKPSTAAPNEVKTKGEKKVSATATKPASEKTAKTATAKTAAKTPAKKATAGTKAKAPKAEKAAKSAPKKVAAKTAQKEKK